jgi:muramoyltetrapeptide carboxypeptidase LdcA involved in peptidoglycan recycling
LLEQISTRQDRLAGLPVLGNVDFGHTNPLATFAIGGRAELASTGSERRGSSAAASTAACT